MIGFNISKVAFSLVALALLCDSFAQDIPPPHALPDDIQYSPYLTETFPNRVFFGDTHLHTAYSADAGLALATTTPDDAYRFAKGEEVVSSMGVRARLQRPLDFLVVSDHAENLGIAIALEEDSPIFEANEWSRTLADLFAPRTMDARRATFLHHFSAINQPGSGDPLAGTGLNETMWHRVTDAAERHNEPGLFTALIGFEWTSAPNGRNLHRNVIFRDGKERADTIVPFSAYDSEDVEDLWQWMADYEDATGGRALAIAHNGNISNGLMFDDVTLTGEAFTTDYAERRQRWEPVYEITQIKGDGETHPLLSPTDEFVDYYRWDKGSFGEGRKTPDMLPREYARPAWKRGLAYEAELGANPFKFGVVGSTDSHTGLSTAQENNFFGKLAVVEPTADPIRFNEQVAGLMTPDDSSDDVFVSDGLASGIAAVWARENTREAIWDAMKRKEVYATTGSRMRVRVFGGWDFEESDLERSDFAAFGYRNGLPMGGDLTMAPRERVPSFLIRVLRDADGANLDRVQMIKGWTTADGGLEERVYDVVWSGDREPNSDGKLPAVGNTVDLKTATYTNAIGAPFLEAFWEDPDFDPAQRAFYYVRVLEIPTPSWLAYDRAFFGVDIPEGKAAVQQERAYTSPIWYTP